MTSTMTMNDYLSHIRESRGSHSYVDVDFVIPVYNEEKDLFHAVTTLIDYLRNTQHQSAHFTWSITIADNASKDGTWGIASELADFYPDTVRALRIDRKGRGFALKTAWLSSSAHVVAYMDVDLSTDLSHINDIVVPLLERKADIAIGSRLAYGAQTTRSFTREFISRTYNFLLHLYSRAQFSDAQCGFKAVRAQVFRDLYTQLLDNEWFFDTELLLVCQHYGYTLHEVPVRWVEDTNSSVHIVNTASKDVQGMRRVKRTFASGYSPGIILHMQSMEKKRDPLLRGSLIPLNLLTPAS